MTVKQLRNLVRDYWDTKFSVKDGRLAVEDILWFAFDAFKMAGDEDGRRHIEELINSIESIDTEELIEAQIWKDT